MMNRAFEKTGYKAITSVPGWSELFRSNEISGTAQAYAYVPLVFRALKLRCDGLARTPITITGKGGAEKEWPFPEPLSKLIWRTEAARLLKGASYWEKVANGRGVVKNVKWRNPFDITVEYAARQEEGKPRQDLILFKQGMVSSASWTNNLTAGAYEMVYLPEFHPLDDIGPGISAAAVAMTDTQLLRYLSRFASIFFEQGGMPIWLLPFENIAEPEAKKVENFFKRQAAGIRNAFRILALRGKVAPVQITPPLKDLALPDLYEQARRNVADAFGVPLPLLENPANRSVTEELRLSFFQDTVEPSGIAMAEGINEQLLSPLGLEMAFAFEQLDIYQVDEADRAGSLSQLTAAGIPLKLAMEILGYDLTEEQWAELAAQETEKKERAEELTNNLTNANQNGQNNQNGNSQEQEMDEASALRADLERWQRKALKRLKDGKSAACEFTSEWIPEQKQQTIAFGLKGCTTPDDVRAVFAGVGTLEEGGYAGPGDALDRLADELKAAREALEAAPLESEPKSKVTEAQELVIHQAPLHIKLNVPEQPAPVVNVTTPEVIVNVPEQQPPVVNVTVPEQAPPNVTVNVPEQPSPVVNVSAPEVTVNVTPEVTVKQPEKPARFTVSRDRAGNITEVKEE